MKRWNTDKIIELLKDDRWTISTMSPGGDWDTRNLSLASSLPGDGDRLFILGFVFGDAETFDVEQWDDVDIEMIEVTDGNDSRGGLNSNEPEVIEMYHEVCKRLRLEGFEVVNKMDDYF